MSAGPVLGSTKPTLPPAEIGWPLLPVPDAAGALAWPDLDTSVRQTIEAILRTSPGERIMRPAFGAGLERLVHMPNTLETRASAQAAVEGALRLHEPRILLDRVDVDEGADPRELLIVIAYRLRPTGAPRRLEARAMVGAL
jgi:uncharacterized protein